jgi:hypothetical protein
MHTSEHMFTLFAIFALLNQKKRIMPRGDRTGPMGQGPVTGRGLGYCSDYESSGFTKGFGMGGGFGRAHGFGRSTGRGMGYGRSYGFVPWPSYSKENEIQILKDQAESLKRAQKNIEKRLGELEKETDRSIRSEAGRGQGRP